MNWHYQVRKKVIEDETVFDLVEVYKNPRVWTEKGMKPIGNTKKEVIQILEMMLDDAKKYPVLHDKGIKGK